MNDEPNKVTTVLKVVVTGEFYDDDATEETLRYAVEQDLEDAGFDVDVTLLKEQKAVVPFYGDESFLDYFSNHTFGRCGHCKAPLPAIDGLRSKFCWMCGRQLKWDNSKAGDQWKLSDGYKKEFSEQTWKLLKGDWNAD